MVTVLKQAEADLNTDRKLADSYSRAGNVVLPMLFTLGAPRGKPDHPLPDYVLKDAIAAAPGSSDVLPLPTSSVQLPVDIIARTAAISTPIPTSTARFVPSRWSCSTSTSSSRRCR